MFLIFYYFFLSCLFFLLLFFSSFLLFFSFFFFLSGLCKSEVAASSLLEVPIRAGHPLVGQVCRSTTVKSCSNKQFTVAVTRIHIFESARPDLQTRNHRSDITDDCLLYEIIKLQPACKVRRAEFPMSAFRSSL